MISAAGASWYSGTGNAAEALRRGHRPVEARPVVADDREMLAALEALRREAAGESAHLRRHLGPGPGLPDAEVLLADGRMRAPHARVVRSSRGNVSSPVGATPVGTAGSLLWRPGDSRGIGLLF